MSGEFPKGWAETTLGQICSKPQYGWTCRAAKNGKIKYLRTSDISEGKIDWQSVPYCEEIPDDVEKYQVYPDDILVARAGSVGVSHRVRDTVHEAVFASYLIRFTALEGIDPRFIEFFLKSQEYWQAISDFAAGIAIPNVNATKLASLELPLAPLNEQHRIVAKLEKLLGKVDGCQQRLMKIPLILKRFRQSVLAAACSGRLTADWRETSPGPKNHPEEELPAGWRTALVGQVIDNLKYGTAQKCSYERRGVPVLRIPNIEQGVISHSDLKYAELPENEFQQLRLKPGDILLIRSNGSVSLVGKSALVRKAELDFAYAGYLIRLRPNVEKVLPEFLNLVLGSHEVRIQIEVPARSTSGVNNINSEEVRALQFFLPLLPEQQEIVRRVEALFALADQIETRFVKAKARVDQLTQSLLAKAFRGELVPQDPNDEPASVLLERIKSERKEKDPGIKRKK